MGSTFHCPPGSEKRSCACAKPESQRDAHGNLALRRMASETGYTRTQQRREFKIAGLKECCCPRGSLLDICPNSALC